MRTKCSIQLLDWNKEEKLKYPSGSFFECPDSGKGTSSPFYKKIKDLCNKHQDFVERRAHKDAGTLGISWEKWEEQEYEGHPFQDSTDQVGSISWQLDLEHSNFFLINPDWDLKEDQFNKAKQECTVGLPDQVLTLKEENKESFKLMYKTHFRLVSWSPPKLLDSNLVNYTPDKFWKLIQDEFSNSNIVVLSVQLWNNLNETG